MWGAELITDLTSLHIQFSAFTFRQSVFKSQFQERDLSQVTFQVWGLFKMLVAL